MLPNPALKPVYDKVEWVYVYRDFSGKPMDKAAERISMRFGVTSWPQLFLADPNMLKILAHTGRTPTSFLDAVRRVNVQKATSLQALEEMRAAEKRASQLEKDPDPKLALKYLEDEDVVVQTLALRILSQQVPKEIVSRATRLLEVPHDPFRYEVCKVLEKAKSTRAAEALESLLRRPKESLNPNVLRIHAVRALATCGTAKSVEVIAPFAASGQYYNGLTGAAVDALASIAARDTRARKAVRSVLKSAYPPPPSDSDERATRFCVNLARRIHEKLGEKKQFPREYNETTRAALMR